MTKLTSAIRQAIVQDIARLAREKYILPEKGLKTARTLESHLQQGHYDDILSPQEFADRLTSDLRQASADQHWSVSYDSTLTSALYGEAEEVSEEDLAQLKEHLYRMNFGIRKVEHLPGNVGYVDLREFSWIGFPGAGESIVALMQLISHCDALIFDLRHNHGGEVETLQLYISYFVHPEPKFYDSLYYRPTNETQQLWTFSYVPGNRMPDTPLYILTSGVTGSGGEAFAYILRSMGRATVVGETTTGAAHTTDMEIVQQHFQVEFPSGRSISPFTQGDWEGTGVFPDLAVPADKALEVAHLAAVERLIAACADEQLKQALTWDLEIAHNIYHSFSANESMLRCVEGSYGDRRFTIQNGALAYSRQGNPPQKLIALSGNRYLYSDTIKFEFELDEVGKATAVTVSYRDDREPIKIARSIP